jgi:hypothetical protein
MADPNPGVNDARADAFDPQAQGVPAYDFYQRMAR